jgi:hypothetical protein
VSLEPSLVATVNRLEAADVTDWDDYRKCSQICRAEIGEACFSMSGRIIGGRPDGVRTYLAVAHASRKKRTRR